MYRFSPTHSFVVGKKFQTQCGLFFPVKSMYGTGIDIFLGIYWDSSSATLTLQHSTLNYNSANIGGAVFMTSGSSVVADCIMNHNRADSYGGGRFKRENGFENIFIFCLRKYGDFFLIFFVTVMYWMSTSIFTMQRSILKHNSANDGGAIYFTSGTAFVTLCSVNNNSAGAGGGGK